ncbi:hypothetical protein [Nocardia vaccinii]|uniref:hypothetical protein n=1 Tax=Nocardia vaccinii TaxID=1822 RepID=UPI0008313017|nr:hypothetical protein [Nocardia vaccinii]
MNEDCATAYQRKICIVFAFAIGTSKVATRETNDTGVERQRYDSAVDDNWQHDSGFGACALGGGRSVAVARGALHIVCPLA